MKTIENKSIAIIGGGPAGLTLARLLQMNGNDVRVYERDLNRSARVQGATLDLHHDSGLKALSKAGLMDAFRANYRPGADRVVIVDQNANVLLDEFSSEDFGEERPEIDRGPLREILLDSLLEDTVVWDSQFSSLTRDEDGFALEFTNGTSARADLVVGADGANSKIRPYVTNIEPIYSGVTVIEGSVYESESVAPEIHKLMRTGKVFALGNEKVLVAGTKGDGSLAFYLSLKAAESWFRSSDVDFSSRISLLAWFREEFAGWAPLWDELLLNAEPKFTPRPQYYMPLDQGWDSLPNVTLIGDAAHVMPPFAGEGVNVAMLDALQLAECLLDNRYADAHSAIAAYEARMRVRASAAVQESMDQTVTFHSPDAISKLLEMFMHFQASASR